MALVDSEYQLAGLQPEELGAEFDLSDQDNYSNQTDKMPTHPFHGSVRMGSEDVQWTLEVPRDLSFDGIAVISPGFLAIKQSSRPPRNALAQEGIAALSYSPARSHSDYWWTTVQDPQKLHADTQKEIARDIRTRIDIRGGKAYGNKIKVDNKIIVAHSMGGLAATKYAQMEPDNVRMIKGLATCGFGHPTLPELAADLPLGMVDGLKSELLPAIMKGNIALSLRNLRDIVCYLKHLRVVFEGISCVFEDDRANIAKLRERGITYIYEAYEKDILVRADETVAEHVDYHSIIPGAGHLEPQLKPEGVAGRIALDLARID
jgi:pimeloyl-ACP methyl ester carboxylesterase